MRKKKPIRLTGRALAELNKAIHERDCDSCIICGHYVPEGVKFHHHRQGPDKEDIIENGVVLCMVCHYELHHGKHGREYKNKVEEYLRSLYGI